MAPHLGVLVQRPSSVCPSFRCPHADSLSAFVAELRALVYERLPATVVVAIKARQRGAGQLRVFTEEPRVVEKVTVEQPLVATWSTSS